MSELVGDKEFEVKFKDHIYLVRLASDGEQKLFVEVEDKLSGDIWHNLFTARYVEHITRRTGSEKSFPVFLRMLIGALSSESTSVILDFLTVEDLEKTRAGKSPPNSKGLNSESTLVDTSKVHPGRRYLIITYTVEFDTVHYPLPLNFEQVADPERQRKTIIRLRRRVAEMESIAVDPKELESLRKENQVLKARVQTLEKTCGVLPKKSGQSDFERLRRDHAALKSEKVSLEQTVSKLQAENQREVQFMKREMQRLVKEVEHQDEELAELSQRKVSNSDSREIKRLQKRLDDGEAAYEQLKADKRRAAVSFRRERESLNKDLAKSAERERVLRMRLRARSPSVPQVSRAARPRPTPKARAPSPGRSYRSPVQSPSARPARPASAPPRRRFNPTAYVKEQQAKKAAARSRSRSPAPAPVRRRSRDTPPRRGRTPPSSPQRRDRPWRQRPSPRTSPAVSASRKSRERPPLPARNVRVEAHIPGANIWQVRRARLNRRKSDVSEGTGSETGGRDTDEEVARVLRRRRQKNTKVDKTVEMASDSVQDVENESEDEEQRRLYETAAKMNSMDTKLQALFDLVTAAKANGSLKRGTTGKRRSKGRRLQNR